MSQCATPMRGKIKLGWKGFIESTKTISDMLLRLMLLCRSQKIFFNMRNIVREGAGLSKTCASSSLVDSPI